MTRRVFSAALLVLIIGIGGVALAQVKSFVIGGKERPWKGWGTFEVVDDRSKPGWIQPIKTSREVNILHQLYEEGRLFALEEPIEAWYRPGDGRMWTPNAPFRENSDMAAMLADGKDDSLSFNYFNRAASNVGVCIYIDLGAAYPVDEISFYPLCREKLSLKVQQAIGLAELLKHEDLYMKGYELYANDGRPETLDEWGKPIWHLLDAVPTNTERVVVNTNFPPQHIRYIKLRCTSPMAFEIDQIEVRGEGWLRQATFTSEILDLGDIANFGKLRWSAEEEPGSQVRIYTRNGRDKTTLIYYMVNDIGEFEPLPGKTDEENRKAWERLPEAARGPVVDDTDNWTMWSARYDSSGQDVFAYGPRRYFQLKVIMESQEARTRALVDSISFEYSQPVSARMLLGEISPRVNVDLGKEYAFKYKVAPAIGDADIGFDTIQIRTPIKASVETVRVGNRVISEGDYEAVEEKNRLTVRLLKDRITSDEDSLEVSFDCAILAFGSVFEGMAFASWEENLLGQRIEVEEIEELSVRASLESLGRVLGDVDASPNPFTPNDDGTNDEVTISFKLFQMIGEAPLSVEVYDLSGILVKSVFSKVVESDYYSMEWDGTDEDGQLVPPGVYVYQISVEGDAERFVKTGTVVVAY